MNTVRETSGAVPQYGAVAKIMHWIIFLFVAAQFIVAWVMSPIEWGTKPETLINLHLSLGALLMLLMLFRQARRCASADASHAPRMKHSLMLSFLDINLSSRPLVLAPASDFGIANLVETLPSHSTGLAADNRAQVKASFKSLQGRSAGC